MNLQLAIENLYKTFSKYTTEGIEYCDCGCISEEDVKKLNSKSLRKLKSEDLISYHGSALYTWGDIEHYKHYLPRICELISVERDFSFVDFDELYTKLDYAKWTKWPQEEQQAIYNYVIADWNEFTKNRFSEIRDIDIESYGKFLGIETILSHWNIIETDESLRNFVYFFYMYGNQIFTGKLRVLDKKQKEEFLKWIEVEKLVKKLENAFFINESKDSEYSSKISIVLQMIEQNRKLR